MLPKKTLNIRSLYRLTNSFRLCRLPRMQECNKTRLYSNVTKSLNDTREYRAFSLSNGLRALVIADLKSLTEASQIDVDDDDGSDAASLPRDSEEEEEESMVEDSEDSDCDGSEPGVESEIPEKNGSSKTKETGQKLSAAALCIGSGSFSDPGEIPGLAHFLEHMVFMGSKKYPDENCFDSFLKAYGGSSNAYTDCERTVFYFDIRKKYFREALDIFAQFFVSPLLKQNSVDREVKAVDSEFDMSKQSDTTRAEQLFGTMAKENHPMGKFFMGSVESLKTTPQAMGINVYDKLQTFHQKQYSAHYMTLAVQSKDTLDQLEEWVDDIFSHIPNNGRPQDCFKDLKDPFETEKFFKLYKVIPVKNNNTLEVRWALPPQLQHYKVKPLHYLGWLIGHEGKGSILSYLKKRYWATGLDGGNSESGFEHNSTYAVFSISVDLTDAGMDNYLEVITVIFEYLAMLKKAGPQKRIFNEIQQIEANGFRWQEQCEPVSYVDDVAVSMQCFPPEDYLTGDQLLFHYDPQVIEECMNYLKPSKANICVTSKQFETTGECRLKEKWYQIPYSVEDIRSDFVQRWEYIAPREDIFHLPEPNDYIATDFSIRDPHLFTTPYPKTISDTDSGRLWFKKDTKFKVPKARFMFRLVSNLVMQSPTTVCLMDLFTNTLDLQLGEVAYAADMALLNYSISYTDQALIIKVSGFNQKLPKLFETLVEHIANFELTQDLFNAVKEQLEREYYNACIKPGKLNTDLRLQMLQDHYWPVTSRTQVLGNLDRETLLKFVQEFRTQLYIEGLIQGNVTEEEALQLHMGLQDRLQCRPLARDLHPKFRVTKIPAGEWFCRCENFNKSDSNSVITNYYQFGPATIRQSCLNELLCLLMHEPCFDVLRTREQLGYEVYNTNRITSGILALSVTVCSQADKFSLDQLNDRIEAFLIEFEGILDKMTTTDFIEGRDSLIVLKQCEDRSLKEEVNRNWSEVDHEDYLFDRIVKEVEILQTITKDEVVEWLKNYTLGNGTCRKLSVQVMGHTSDGSVSSKTKTRKSDKPPEPPTGSIMTPHFLPVDAPFKQNVITNPVHFKNKHTLYPVSKIIH